MSLTNPRAVSADPRPRGRPSSGGGEQLRADVLSAARQVYAVEGYANSSVAKLCAAANLSRPTFYKLFRDKHHVIDAVVADVNASLRQRIAAAIDNQPSPLRGVKAAVDAYFAWCIETGPIVGRIYAEVGNPTSPAYHHRQQAIAEFVRVMHAEAVRYGLPNQPPLFYDSLVRVVENAGSQSVWPSQLSATEIENNKRVALGIVMSAAKHA